VGRGEGKGMERAARRYDRGGKSGGTGQGVGRACGRWKRWATTILPQSLRQFRWARRRVYAAARWPVPPCQPWARHWRAGRRGADE
jgi:hypothetical protein